MNGFEPDILNGVGAARGEVARVRPERRLMVAVLADALDCFQKNMFASHPKRQRLFREAEAWILSEANWVFSFRHICEVLGIDADAVRRQTRIWRSHRVRALMSRQPADARATTTAAAR